MSPKKILAAIAVLSVPAFLFTVGCTKNSNPKPPIHDTLTVIKKDTVTDTLYATKPDPTVNLTKGLLVYLPFSGNFADSSGNNNPTTAVGSVLTYDAHGWANNAFGSSSGQKILVTNNGSIKFDTAYSISFGFMINAAGPQTYISMVNPDNGRGPSFIIGTSLPAVPYMVMGIEDETLGCDKEGVNDTRNITDTSAFTPQPGNWYNYIAIYHNGSLQMYINGVLIATKVGTGTRNMLCPDSKIIIGAWWNGGGQNMNGRLDNFRLYNRALTNNEIARLSQNYQVTSNSVKPQVQTH